MRKQTEQTKMNKPMSSTPSWLLPVGSYPVLVLILTSQLPRSVSELNSLFTKLFLVVAFHHITAMLAITKTGVPERHVLLLSNILQMGM